MSDGGWLMALVVVLTLATLVFVIASMARSIRNERSCDGLLWREFGFSRGLVLMVRFF